MPTFPALSHIAITVNDLAAGTAWYAKLFDAQPVLDENEASGTFHHTVFALDGGMLFGLHTHATSDAGDAGFDERDVGLDHVAFTCTQNELDEWVARLDAVGIAHSGIKHAHYGSRISFRDPDNIALEFFAAPAG